MQIANIAIIKEFYNFIADVCKYLIVVKNAKN